MLPSNPSPRLISHINLVYNGCTLSAENFIPATCTLPAFIAADWKLCRSTGMCRADGDTGGARCARWGKRLWKNLPRNVRSTQLGNHECIVSLSKCCSKHYWRQFHIGHFYRWPFFLLFDCTDFPYLSLPAVCLLFLQLCVSKCPDRFVTYIDVQASYRYKPDQWNCFKKFCKPGFNSPCKVCKYQETMEYLCFSSSYV